MDVLSVIHGENVRSNLFGEVVAARGHRLDEWSLAWGTPPPRPLDSYGAVLVFGGSMHPDQDEHHPWLADEDRFLQRLLELRVPLLGVCLGAQLIAKASRASVYRSPEPEVGWATVKLAAAARHDPVLGRLPGRFEAFEWHYYTYDLPAGAVELARSPVCTQAFRLGDAAWGIQFHAEVTMETIRAWLDESGDEVAGPIEAFEAASRERIDGWNELGRGLCGAFCEVAERVALAA